MNKTITLGALALGVVFLAGCGQQQASQVTPSTPNPTVQQPQVAANDNVQATTQSAPKTDETANWKTYTNSKFGFEIKYPSNWKISTERSDAGSVVWDIPGGAGTESREAVNFEANSKKLTLNQVKSEIIPDKSAIAKETQVSVGGEKALKIDTTEFGISHIIFLHNGNIYDIETQGGIIDKMLATFNFAK